MHMCYNVVHTHQTPIDWEQSVVLLVLIVVLLVVMHAHTGCSTVHHSMYVGVTIPLNVSWLSKLREHVYTQLRCQLLSICAAEEANSSPVSSIAVLGCGLMQQQLGDPKAQGHNLQE